MRIRTEPWSTESQECLVARTFVELPTGADRNAIVRIFGTSRSARHCVQLASGDDLWELPNLPQVAPNAPLLLHLVVNGRASRLALSDVEGHRGAPARSLNGEGRDELGPTAKAWERLHDHHVERIAEWTDGVDVPASVIRASGQIVIDWTTFSERYWRADEGDVEAPRHLIVEIAQVCTSWIVDLCERPRRILRRIRSMQSIAQAQDVDAACIRWLTRQPGLSIAERAGPRQQILAVHREESVDTPENRILRDFLRLSAQAADRYIRAYRQHNESSRWKSVSRYAALVRRLLNSSPIATVPGLVGEPTRNYVLQFDLRYSRLWTYYSRLRRQEDERDELASWSHRLWAEHCCLAVRRVLDRITTCDEPATSDNRYASRRLAGPARLRREAVHGQFLDPRTDGGAWLPEGTRQLAIRIVPGHALADSEAPSLKAIASLVPDFALTQSAAFGPDRSPRVIGVWGLFSPEESTRSLMERVERLRSALRSVDVPDCGGLLLVPAIGAAEEDPDVRQRDVITHRLALPHSDSRPQDDEFAAQLRLLLDPTG